MTLNLNQTVLRVSAGLPKQFPASPIPQVAFSGRSNVGKSSLINSLLARKSLARVSSAPGKTVTVNFYEIDRKLFFVDLPGYGFAKRTREEQIQWSNLTDGYFTKNPNLDLLRLVVQLIDSRVGPTDDDKMMLDFLRRSGIPYLIAATKSDKLNATELAAAKESFAGYAAAGSVPVIFYSSLKGNGRNELWKEIYRATGVGIGV